MRLRTDTDGNGHALTAGCVLLAVAILTPLPAESQDRVSDTVHNLSVSGPGLVRAPSEQQVCIFCHASHNTGGMSPLWNREMPSTSYTIYQFSTLDAKPGQPTGSSKLCLSCHDGTIALGSVLSRSDKIRLSGSDYMPSGLTNLGTDLSDDHPISFFYTDGIAASDLQLASPTSLRRDIKLDSTGQLQCTACHDPHNNVHGDFLVMRNEFGALCIVCHVMDGWQSCSHRTSSAVVAGSATVDWPFSSVAENACRGCHRPHSAEGRERLLLFEKEEENCLSCHDGTVGRTNIEAELNKISAHDPRNYLGLHDPVEIPTGEKQHVECSDCHNPHAVAANVPTTTYVPIGATLAETRGITSGGGVIDEARYEYEVCFRCHGDSPVLIRGAPSRQTQTANLRLKFSPGNPSYHPIVVTVRNRETVSLMTGIAPGSMIRCTDCHNNDAGTRTGGSGPDGPHGSIYPFLLERNYTIRDDNAESAFEYALCYKCHERTSILSDQSFPFHSLHVEDDRAPCSACHDPHGVNVARSLGSDHTHLINFDTAIVRPESVTGRMEYNDLGVYVGSCTLLCHGYEHVNTSYGGGGLQAPLR